MKQATKNKWSLAILTIVSTLASFHTHASVTYNYIGNSFTESPSGMIGNWITASVTFNNPLVTGRFTGDVDENSVSAWSIQVAQLPNSKLDNTNGWHNQWPLWFHFENGVVTGWQLLAAPNNQSFPEIYTTHNSAYPRINPTADYYALDPNNNYGINYNQAGNWSVVPVPAAVWLFSSALFGLGFIGKSRFTQKQT